MGADPDADRAVALVGGRIVRHPFGQPGIDGLGERSMIDAMHRDARRLVHAWQDGVGAGLDEDLTVGIGRQDRQHQADGGQILRTAREQCVLDRTTATT